MPKLGLANEICGYTYRSRVCTCLAHSLSSNLQASIHVHRCRSLTMDAYEAAKCGLQNSENHLNATDCYGGAIHVFRVRADFRKPRYMKVPSGITCKSLFLPIVESQQKRHLVVWLGLQQRPKHLTEGVNHVIQRNNEQLPLSTRHVRSKQV